MSFFAWNMEMSFFVVCPLRNCECKAPKIGMNCNQSLIILFPFDSSRFSGQLSRIYKACPGAMLRIPFLVCNEYGIFNVILSPCKPGLGQGHTKKRHLHAQQKVSFIYVPGAERLGHLLNTKTQVKHTGTCLWKMLLQGLWKASVCMITSG